MLGERRQVVLTVPPSEDSGVDLWVEGLHPPTEELGEVGHHLDARHVEPEPLELGGRSPACKDLDPEVDETARQLVEPCLVVDREKGVANHSGERKRSPSSCRAARGRRRCSTTCRRSSSEVIVSPARIGTGSCMITGPVSIPSSTS